MALALGTAVLTSACATMRRDEAKDTDALLAAAGFTTKPADTDDRLAELKAMPALKLVSRVKDGQTVYTYADPYNCHCLYVGGPQNYQDYQRLAVQERIARDQLMAAEEMRDAAMDWELWGPWGW
jgi:hypothetical protein